MKKKPQTFREKAHKESPHIAKVTDFLTQHETKLKRLYKKYKSETGENMPFEGFVFFIYENAQDLVLNPKNN